MQFAIIFITSALQKLCKVFKSREILRDNFEQDILALFLPKCNIYIYICTTKIATLFSDMSVARTRQMSRFYSIFFPS